MRLWTIAFLLILALAPAPLLSHTAEHQQPAHGTETASNQQAHPSEEHRGPHEKQKFAGLPYWVWNLVNMLLFFAFLGWVLGGPVKKAFAERGAQIRHEAEEARERRSKAEALARDIQSRLERLDSDLRAILERAKAEGERQKQEMIAAAAAEANKLLQNARSEVDNRIKNARHELIEYAGELATERAEAILREKITEEDRRKLFADSVREVEEAPS